MTERLYTAQHSISDTNMDPFFFFFNIEMYPSLFFQDFANCEKLRVTFAL